jgi:hypothetical protein
VINATLLSPFSQAGQNANYQRIEVQVTKENRMAMVEALR